MRDKDWKKEKNKVNIKSDNAKVLDFVKTDWWGKNYRKFEVEIEKMVELGWTIHSSEPEDKPTRVVLYPPDPKEESA